MTMYKTYQFIDKDPIIDFIRTVISDSKITMKRLSEESGVSQGTIRNWLYGDTKRPQVASVNAVLRVCDYKLTISSVRTPDIIRPTPYQPQHIHPSNVKNMSDYHKRARKVGKVK